MTVVAKPHLTLFITYQLSYPGQNHQVHLPTDCCSRLVAPTCRCSFACASPVPNRVKWPSAIPSLCQHYCVRLAVQLPLSLWPCRPHLSAFGGKIFQKLSPTPVKDHRLKQITRITNSPTRLLEARVTRLSYSSTPASLRRPGASTSRFPLSALPFFNGRRSLRVVQMFDPFEPPTGGTQPPFMLARSSGHFRPLSVSESPNIRVTS